MKRLSLIILSCLLLSGCIFDPVFDTSNVYAFQNSLAAIKAKLSNDDLRRLDVALRYLAAESGPRINGQPFNTVSMAANANPYVNLAWLGPRLNGNTAAGVVQNLSIKLDAEIAELEKRLGNSEGALGSVEVRSASYEWRRTGAGRSNFEQPFIEFTVRNGGATPISRIYFTTTLVSPGRSIPWARQEFVQTFNGGLEPREKQQLTLQVGGVWNDQQLKYLPNAELKVVVTKFEDANGARMIVANSDLLDFKRKVRAALH